MTQFFLPMLCNEDEYDAVKQFEVEDVLHTSVDVAPLLLEERKEQTNNSNL